MSRKYQRARRWLIGTLDRRNGGTLAIDDRVVGRVEFRAAINAHRGRYPHLIENSSAAIRRARTARGRKAALLARRPLTACFHEFNYQESVIGDGGVVNGTYIERWLECELCGAREPASWGDAPTYEDY